MGQPKRETWDLNAGDMRQQITIETGAAATADSVGGIAINWPTDADGNPTGNGTSVVARCKIDVLSGDKLTLARQLVENATHQVTIRYRPALDPDRNGTTDDVLILNRLRYKDGSLNAKRGIFSIGHIEDVEMMHVTMILTCTEWRG